MRSIFLKTVNLCFLVLVLFLSQEVNARLVDDCRVTIEADGLDICEGGSIDITANPTFEVESYQWYKDGVLYRSGTSNILTVSEAGTYYVRAIPREDACEEGFYDSNTLGPFTVSRRQPVTIVTTPPTSGCSGDAYSFRISETFPAGTTYEWDFGDGATQPTTEPTVAHTFQALGAGSTGFTVSVTAITPLPGGCGYPTGSASVTVQRQPDIPFDISWEKEDGTTGAGNSYCVEEGEEEDDISIKPILTIPSPHAGALEYFVDWGDGAGEQRRVAGDFPLTGPAYTEVGDYDIKVRARGTNGCENTFETTFSVSEEPEASIEEEGTQSADPNAPAPDPDGKRRRRPSPREGDKGCEPIIIPFKSTSTGGGLTYKWEILKDGQPADPSTYEIESGDFDQETLELKFFVSGQYQAKLTVFNACGPEEGVESTYPFIVGYPQITMPPSEDICGPLPGETPQRASYTVTTDLNTQSGQGDFIDFNFADKIKKFTLTISHTDGTVIRYDESNNGPFNIVFDKIGTYTITAFAENECGTSDDAGGAEPQVVRVLPPLTQAPTVQNPPVSCPGGTVTINASLPSASGVNFRLIDPQGGALESPTGRFEIPAPAGNTEYTVVAFNEVCISPAAPVSVTVLSEVTNEITLTQTQICAGDRPAEITGNNPLEQVADPNSVTVIYTWERSTSAAGPFSLAPSSSDSPNNGRNYRPGVLNETTWFRRVVRVGNCEPNISEPLEIQALPPITNNTTIAGEQEVCADATPERLTGENPGGGNGNPSIEWQYSTTGANATDFVAADGTNNEANYTFTGPIAETRWYRRVARAGDCEVISNTVQVRVVNPIDPNSNTLTPPSQATTCSGSSPGIIAGSTPTGGAGGYTYQWQVSTSGDSGPFENIPSATARDYTPGNLTQTSWFRRIVRSGNCPEHISGAVRVVVTTVTAEDNTIRTEQPQVCAGTPPQQISGTAISGGVSYRWESSISGPTSGFTPIQNSNTQNYTPPAITRDTWYRRVVISGTCEVASEPVLLQVQTPPPAPVPTTNDVKACRGGSATLAIANPGNYQVRWYSSSNQVVPEFTGNNYEVQNITGPATYFVELFDPATQCTSPTRVPVSITVVEPVATAEPQNRTIIQGEPIELRATGGVSYQWEPAESLSNPNVPNPVARPQVTTTYTVTVTTAEGCTATAEVTVVVTPALVIPNAFSPNGDRVNDVWEIENIQSYPDARVEIFNRWGNQVFSSTGYATPWDGRLNGQNLPVATYYYIIYLNSSERPLSGHVTIIR